MVISVRNSQILAYVAQTVIHASVVDKHIIDPHTRFVKNCGAESVGPVQDAVAQARDSECIKKEFKRVCTRIVLHSLRVTAREPVFRRDVVVNF